MKAYLTVIINGVQILALQNKEPVTNESESKVELEKAFASVETLDPAPIEVADRSDLHRGDSNDQASRPLKRTLNQQPPTAYNDSRRNQQQQQQGGKRGRREQHQQQHHQQSSKRSLVGNWGDSRYDGRRSVGAGGGRFSSSAAYGYPAHAGYGGHLNPEDMAAEMMMMQAQLNQTIQNQLMMLNPGGRGYSSGGGARYGGGGGGGRRGGRGGGGGGGSMGRKHFGGGGW